MQEALRYERLPDSLAVDAVAVTGGVEAELSLPAGKNTVRVISDVDGELRSSAGGDAFTVAANTPVDVPVAGATTLYFYSSSSGTVGLLEGAGDGIDSIPAPTPPSSDFYDTYGVDGTDLHLWLEAATVGNTVALWQDSSDDGNDAVQANVARQPSAVGGSPAAYTFSGAGYAHMSSGDIDELEAGAVTGIAWAKPSSMAGGVQGYLGKKLVWQCYIDGPQQRAKANYFGTGIQNTVQTNAVLVVDTWYHIAFTYNGLGQGRIYLNSSLHDTRNKGSNPLTSNTNNVTVGAANDLMWFPGDIGAAIAFGRCLTPAEILTHYDASKSTYGH